MSATVTDTCPAWCSTHDPPADATNTAMHLVSDLFPDTLAAGWRIGVAQEDSRPATVDPEAGGADDPDSSPCVLCGAGR